MRKKLLSLLVLLMVAVTGAWAETTIVTWTSSGSYENNNSRGGVTLSGEVVEYIWDDLSGGEWRLAYDSEQGTFTTSLGNFTSIVISGGDIDGFSGTGWNGRTWTGNASSVPFRGYLTDVYGEEPWTITFTIAPAEPVASWVGNSAINANGTWYYAGSNFGWCTGGAFNGADLGTITTLSLGGQSQAWAEDNANWNDGNLTMTMGYKIDGGADESLSLNWFEFADNNNKFQSGGSSWAAQDIDISGLTPGNHTIAVWFTRDDKWDSNNSANYVANFTIPTPAATTYTVSVKEGTEDADKWTADPNPAEAGQTVTVTYSGLKKVKSVKAVKKAAAPAEEPVTLATPLTLEATSDGTIVVNNPMEGMKYSLNGAAKTTDGIAEINVSAGDKVAFYGDGTNITAYFVNVRTYTGIAGGTATVKVYGNIMSLVDEEGFATATELTEKCAFYYLFDSNTTLTDASGLLLPATTLTIDCYNSMFRNCTSLTTSPAELPATTLANRCYASMFHGCTSLATAPELPATTLNERCYYSMFRNCESLTTAPELKAETLTPDCYASMFQGCTSLATAPELKATTLAESCYDYMFQGCTSLTAVPELKATTLKVECYRYMFQGCTSLTAVPADLLPATELAQECYYSMFNGCTGLTTVPADFLPATTLAEGCYYYMFNGCTGLTTVPTDLLKAEELAKQCYCKMFMGCTGLTAAPNLPATTLPESCYQGMFQGCTGLTAAPAFGTMTTVGKNSCKNMFQGCTGLTAAPALGATTLDEGCYYSMFQGCEALTTVPAKLPAQTLAKDCYNSMFMGCTSLTTAPAIDATTLANTCCSSMFQDCASLTAAPELPATTLATSCYQKMFMGCISLTAAPALPAMELANTCYLSMFQGCTSLTTAPELPATTLKVQCYRNMFQGCTSLPAAPELPAQTLVSNCYNGMFQDCPSLASVTCLATNISASGCLTNWLINAGTMATEPKLYVDASMTEAAWNNGIFTVTVNAPAGPTAYTLAESTQGMIVGTDGKAYDVANKDNLPDGVTAAGVVVYKNGANGLAIALTDEASMMDWATACGESGAAAHTPTVEGQTWKLPSQEEWTLVKNANSGTSLNSAITSAGGTAIPTVHFDHETQTMTGQYWLSTQGAIDESARTWGINGYDEIAVGSQSLKTDNLLVRACLAW